MTRHEWVDKDTIRNMETGELVDVNTILKARPLDLTVRKYIERGCPPTRDQMERARAAFGCDQKKERPMMTECEQCRNYYTHLLNEAAEEKQVLRNRLEAANRVARAAARLHYLWSEDELQTALDLWRASEDEGEGRLDQRKERNR